MNKGDWYDGSCDVINAFNFVSGKWKLPILWSLSYGSVRYNELKRQVQGITNIMLTRSLQELESHGMIFRIQYSEVPPHVEYGLTTQGKKIIPVLKALKDWGEEQGEFEKKNEINI
ncbi:helix-turn-helix domain-containing protein [Clostridium sp. CTA-7]